MVIADVQVYGAGFSLGILPSQIAPGDFDVIELEFRPQSTEQVLGEVVIVSDDPDEGQLEISLTGNRRGAGLGDDAPEVRVDLAQNGQGQWSLDDERGNIVVLAYFATF